MRFLTLINIRSILLALIPILGIYEIFPSIGLDMLFLSILFFFSFFCSQKISIKGNMALYFFILLLTSLISYGFSVHQSTSLFTNNSIQVLVFAILICYYTSVKINSLFIKTLQLFGIICTIIVIWQTISFWVFNTPLTFFIPLNEDMIKLSETVSINLGRPNSIFREPAHYSIYILPILFYSLNNKRFILAAFYLLGLLLSTSTTGFAAGIIIFLYYMFINGKIKKLVLMVLPLALLPLIFLQDFILLIVDSNLEKLDSDSLGDNIRLFGTSFVLEKMDTFSLFFGVGHNQLVGFMAGQSVEIYNYANSFLMSIFSFGIIGLIAFFWLLIELYKVNNNKGYLILFILILLSDQILFNRNFFYVVICIYFLQNNIAINANKKEEKIFNQFF